MPADHERWWNETAGDAPAVLNVVGIYPTESLADLAGVMDQYEEYIPVYDAADPVWLNNEGPARPRSVRPALCREGEDEDGASPARFLVLGDSHSRVWLWAGVRLGNRVVVHHVAGATLYGLANTTSQSGAAPEFRAALAAAEPGTHLLVQLGEVDAASLFHLRRRRRHRLTYEEQAAESVARLSAFLAPGTTSKFASVTLLGATPPTLVSAAADQWGRAVFAPGGNGVRPHVHASGDLGSHQGRWASTCALNGALAAMARGRGWTYASVTADVWNGREVRRQYLNLAAPDWHLRSDRTYALWISAVRESLGLRYCGANADALAAAAEKSAHLVPLAVLGHGGPDEQTLVWLLDTARPADDAEGLVEELVAMEPALAEEASAEWRLALAGKIRGLLR